MLHNSAHGAVLRAAPRSVRLCGRAVVASAGGTFRFCDGIFVFYSPLPPLARFLRCSVIGKINPDTVPAAARSEFLPSRQAVAPLVAPSDSVTRQLSARGGGACCTSNRGSCGDGTDFFKPLCSRPDRCFGAPVSFFDRLLGVGNGIEDGIWT